jgi:LCP family protein required for cell wall assembly
VIDRTRATCEYHVGVQWLRAHPVLALITVVVGALFGLLTFFVAQPAARFREIASEPFTPADARQAIASQAVDVSPETTIAPEEYEAEARRHQSLASPDRLTPLQLAVMGGADIDDDVFTSILLIGSDASGALADVIILALLPNDGAEPILVSIPRDLWVPNPCTGRLAKINSNLSGCGDAATGPELLALATEDFTGIAVDHYARVNFAGFSNVIDWMGGITVCVSAPTRDAKAHLELDEGCTTADGATALGWVRSRTTEQLVDGEWRVVAGSDFARQQRQQDVLLQLARKLAAYRSPVSLAEALERLGSAVRMDSGWTISQVAALGFRYREIDTDDIARMTLPTSDYRSSGGAWALLPTEPFIDTLATVYSGVLDAG